MMPTFDLIPHPDFPSVAVDAIAVTVERPADGRLSLEYRVSGAVSAAVWPIARHLEFADELWRRSCFEAFVDWAGDGYREINLSPSRQWAAYAFDGYRDGMRRAHDVAVADIVWNEPKGLLSATVDLSAGLSEAPLGLTAVIEAADGSKSYWALAHAAGSPDFHDSASWTARLPVSG